MSLDDLPQTVDRMAAELRTEFSRRLEELSEKLARSTGEERASHAAHVDDLRAQAAAALDAARAEADAERARLEEEHAAAAREQARLHAEAVEAARMHAAEEHARLLDEAVRAMRSQTAEEYARTLDEAVAAARAHADQEAAERLAAAVLESEARALDAGFQAGRAEGRAAERADRAAAETPAGERLLEAVRTIDRAGSLSEILDALLAGTGSDASRVAILLLRGDRLRGWRFAGFGLPLDSASDYELSIDDAGIIAEALRTKTAVSGNDARSAPAFAPHPDGAVAVALPVCIAGETVAVVYADRALEQSADDTAWPARLEVLTRHAARSLESITALKAARLSAPRWSASPRASGEAGTARAAGDAELMART